MKSTVTLALVAIALLFTSCAMKKQADNSKISGTTWELDYISGPRIAFEGLYPDKKPQISFNNETNKV